MANPKVVGTWCYGPDLQYDIDPQISGHIHDLVYREGLRGGDLMVTGKLQELQTTGGNGTQFFLIEFSSADGSLKGNMRLRYEPEKDRIVSNSWCPEKNLWSDDTEAIRKQALEEPAAVTLNLRQRLLSLFNANDANGTGCVAFQSGQSLEKLVNECASLCPSPMQRSALHAFEEPAGVFHYRAFVDWMIADVRLGHPLTRVPSTSQENRGLGKKVVGDEKPAAVSVRDDLVGAFREFDANGDGLVRLAANHTSASVTSLLFQNTVQMSAVKAFVNSAGDLDYNTFVEWLTADSPQKF